MKDVPRQVQRALPQQEATSFSTYGYDSVMALMAALKKAGQPDRDKVAAALADFDMTTSLGTRITFKNPPDGNNVNPSVVAIQITGRGSLRGSLMRYAAC